ncbi:AAA family ATPase [Nonomuraea sp. NPDC048916]|uniref:MinD/ParA family ATP-binding protein n=1 Tax=Nonomuraea sp. NPDC048916 TaxID=3154232 RepID=UPI003404A5B4
MARHDREESLEEQLAWLDAIKETDEAPVKVSAPAPGSPAAASDEPVASPYPQDPWLSVPSQQDTPTPPLFRAAVDSVYGSQAAETLPDGESEAAEWLETAGSKDDTAPGGPPLSLGRPDDAFLAPLKPLPRPDDTDTYTISFTDPASAAGPGPGKMAAGPGKMDETKWPEPPEWPQSPETLDDRRPAGEPRRGAFDAPSPESSRTSDPEDTSERPRSFDEPGGYGGSRSGGSSQEAAPSSGEPGSPARPGPLDQPPAFGRSRSFDLSPPADRTVDQPTDQPADHPFGRPTDRPFDQSTDRPADRPFDQPADRPAGQPFDRPLPFDLSPSDRSQAVDPSPADRSRSAEPARSPDRRSVADQAADQATGRLADQPRSTRASRRARPLDQQESPSFDEPRTYGQPRPEPPVPERHRRPAPVPVFSAPPRPPVTGRPTAESLDPETLLRGRRNAPANGWRRVIYKASGGWIKPGEAPEVRRRRELLTRARTPVATGHHRVAVLSLKGGVGKTTTTVGLGATLAQVRGDRVIAIDANPDRGTLSDKLVLETSATVRDLLNERDQVKRYVDIRAFTSQAPSRLEVLASDRDPSVSEAFSGVDYQSISQVLENFYSICITDCGTGLLHSAMGGVLGLADQIVLVSSPSVDGARAASATLDWLEAHHYGDLVSEATVVLCSVRPRSKSAVDIKKLEAHFAARCRAVIRVPYDPHLEEGAEIDLERLQEATREAYLQLAACVGDGFAGSRG